MLCFIGSPQEKGQRGLGPGELGGKEKREAERERQRKANRPAPGYFAMGKTSGKFSSPF